MMLTTYQKLAISGFLTKLNEFVKTDFVVTEDSVVGKSEIGQFEISLEDGPRLVFIDTNRNMNCGTRVMRVYGDLSLQYPCSFPLDTPGGFIWMLRHVWHPGVVMRDIHDELVNKVFSDEYEFEEDPLRIDYLNTEAAFVRMGNYNEIEGIIYGVYRKEVVCYVFPMHDDIPNIKRELRKIINYSAAADYFDRMRIVKGGVDFYEIVQRNEEEEDHQKTIEEDPETSEGTSGD